jgi:hypothetical protein
MSWLDAVGWAGSALLIVSLTQARVLRFRLLNLLACLVLTGFNAALEVWPMAAVNAVLTAINVWFIVRLLRERSDERVYTVLEVPADDAYLHHFLGVERADIARFFPHFTSAEPGPGRLAFLILKGHETVGAVIARDTGEGVARIDLDYVTERYRDFTPGEFVFRHSRLFRDRGFRRIVTPPDMVGAYYGRLGFVRVGDHWEHALAQA